MIITLQHKNNALLNVFFEDYGLNTQKFGATNGSQLTGGSHQNTVRPRKTLKRLRSFSKSDTNGKAAEKGKLNRNHVRDFATDHACFARFQECLAKLSF